ncbi:hypothetical protein A7G45_23580 [Mycolicibacterium llatzerense]|nr:hypothetical protein [Mycolicibacterium llatzerense]
MPYEDVSAGELDHEYVVIGAGVAGIGVGARLTTAGIDDFVILERAGNVGGTWRDNVYPGVAVDVPGWAYQFSFELNAEWSRLFPPGAEIQTYLEHCADKYALRPRLRLHTEVYDVVYDAHRGAWTVHTSAGRLRARYVVIAIGPFAEPKLPDIPGLDDFKGTVVHTAKWTPGTDVTDENVAVIGTGATAVQVIPEISDHARQLLVFQRTPIWIVPKFDFPLGNKFRSFLRSAPFANRFVRVATAIAAESFGVGLFAFYRDFPFPAKAVAFIAKMHLRRQVRDRQTRQKLSPNYDFGCKRPTISNKYLRTYSRPNVELITDGIERVTPHGIKTVNGKEHNVSMIILATGFGTADPNRRPPVKVVGAGGNDLHTFWRTNRPQAYEGTSVPGFPNLFFVFGPYAFNAGSYTNLVENQATHIIRVTTEARRRGMPTVEITAKANAAYLKAVRSRIEHTIFKATECSGANSYYFDEFGDVSIFRPHTAPEGIWRARRFPLDDYTFSAPTTEPKNSADRYHIALDVSAPLEK